MPPPNEGDRSTSVAIVGSPQVVYAGLEAWFNGSHPRIKIIGHFASPAEFIAAHPTTAAGPVVLFDLPCEDDEPDLDALNQICDAGHRVIVYACLCDSEVVSAATDAGAISCIAKHEPEHVLAAAIYAAQQARPRAVRRIPQTLRDEEPTARPRLSHREQQVLIAWFQTDNKHAVAERLYIEPSTVATHLQRVRAKYAAVGRPAPTKAALVARAIQDDILSIDDL